MIKEKKLTKTVFAQPFYFNKPHNMEWPLQLPLWCQQTQHTLAIIQVKKRLFIINSPEYLYKRHQHTLSTTAIASTRPRGMTPSQDQEYEHQLLTHPKDTHEHQLVETFIINTLSKLATNITRSPLDILKLPYLQHRHTSIKATLLPTTTDWTLMKHLHPTPAVGSIPNTYISNQKTREGFDRGWYSAPLGWLGKNDSQILVGIRSALLDSKHLHIYAGVGIVESSKIDTEWQEIHQKSR